jgi:hypothetical protein
MRIEVLDVDPGGTGERETKSLLRAAILGDPNQADLAWTQLITLSSGFAAQRAGTDRPGLQQKLLGAGLELKAPRSYQADIKRLREYSNVSAEALAQHGQIRIGNAQVKIQRASVQALTQAAQQQSVLVVGEPGAGKSGALYDVLKIFEGGDLDFVFLAVDRLAARSLGELRGEIGLEHELLQVLDNWPGLQPAYLVIDALDAARGVSSERAIHDLIRSVIERVNRWRIVASIRKFDLRYGVELQGLFAGSPPTEFQDTEFKNVHHVNIARLSIDELGQVGTQSPELQALLNLAPDKLRDLLRVPFNLRILADLVGAGISPSQLTPIDTQLDLLERYWLERVIRSDGLGDAREATLHSASERMVRARQLRVSRHDIANSGNSMYVNDLLSAQVLVEWQPTAVDSPDRYTLAFSHHVLFDYAVARLLLRSSNEAVSRQLADDIEMALVVRPSILWHFQYLWSRDKGHQQFWDLVFQVMQLDEIPEIGKLIGPSLAGNFADSLADFETLCTAIEQTSAGLPTAAEQALRHLVGTLLADAPSGVRVAGTGAGPWCELLERVSRSLRPSLAYIIRPLLLELCEHSKDLSADQRACAGKTARRLFELAWAAERRDGWLIIHAIKCVCRTFESDPVSSAGLVRRCLESSHLSQYGFEVMPRLADEIKRLIPLDAELVEEVYRAAFGYVETSDETTSIGQSRILPLSSNRRQDYDMALYELGNVFQEFLERAPRNATRALIAVTEGYVTRRQTPASGKWSEETFDVNGHEGFLRTDYSSIWDNGGVYGTDDPIKMLNTFQGYLVGLANQPEGIHELHSLVQIIIAENRYGVLWRRLLSLGAQYPNVIGQELLPLAWATPILIDYDTSAPAGEFLKVIYPLCSHDERERIERAVMTIPDKISLDRRDTAEHMRNRLLGCIADSELVTDEARHLIAELRKSDVIPTNEPSVSSGDVEWGHYGEEEFLKDQGVPVDAEPNRRIREVERPVKEFADKHLNSVPNKMEIDAVLPALQALHEALIKTERDSAHPLQRDYAWGHLAAACVRIARFEAWSCVNPAGQFITQVLLEAARDPVPMPNPDQDAKFDEFPSWGSPASRIEAAEGLIIISRLPTCATPDVIEMVKQLVVDPVPAVRFQIAAQLNMLYRTEKELMWDIIELICQEETSRGVLQGLLSRPLHHLAGSYPDHVARLTKAIYERIRDGVGAEAVRESCVSIFVGLYLWRDNDLCRQIALEIVSSPLANIKEAQNLLGHLRKPLTHGRTDPSNPKEEPVRQRAVDLLSRLVSSAHSELQLIEARRSGVAFSEWPSEDIKSAQSLVQFIDHVGMEVYFASGAYENKKNPADPNQSPTRQQAARFYRETAAVLEELASLGHPSIAYHLIETLESFIPIDPRGVFLRIGRVVRSGQQGGYQYEIMAADLMVKLVERYLAEYRSLLQEDPECRQTLIVMLDIFVHAGWPSAQRLTYKLEDIFR